MESKEQQKDTGLISNVRVPGADSVNKMRFDGPKEFGNVNGVKNSNGILLPQNDNLNMSYQQKQNV